MEGVGVRMMSLHVSQVEMIFSCLKLFSFLLYFNFEKGFSQFCSKTSVYIVRRKLAKLDQAFYYFYEIKICNVNFWKKLNELGNFKGKEILKEEIVRR